MLDWLQKVAAKLVPMPYSHNDVIQLTDRELIGDICNFGLYHLVLPVLVKLNAYSNANCFYSVLSCTFLFLKCQESVSHS